jgi:hypothetical protein
MAQWLVGNTCQFTRLAAIAGTNSGIPADLWSIFVYPAHTLL